MNTQTDAIQAAADKATALLRSVQCAEPEGFGAQPGMYLHLFHGRKSPDEQLDDWGADGPYFGPLSCVHITYLSGINIVIGKQSTGPMLGALDPLHFVEDLLYYDGMYYGDWELISHT
jgi:hypothetical protein